MKIYATSLIGRSIYSVHSGTIIGTIAGWLVTIKGLRMELLCVKTNDNSTAYLLTNDIRSLGGKVIIDSESKLSEQDELVRHQELIISMFDLMGSKVVSASGQRIGSTKELEINPQDFYIHKIHIRARYIKRLLNERLIIDRTDILEIKKDLVVVKDATIKTKQTATKGLPA